MAKNADKRASVEEVELEGAAVPALEVKSDGKDADDAWIKEQNEAYLHAKLTGERGVWVDSTRDQEGDIAPELGVHPHPELANPAPPESSFSGVAASTPMVKSAEDKQEDSREATEAYNEAVAAREEAFQAGRDAAVTVAAAPVYVVDGPGEGNALPAAPLSEGPSNNDAAGKVNASGQAGNPVNDADSDKE